MMIDPVEALIKEIAAKHGIAIGRDDPILILQSVNARLMADNATAQQVMLTHYKEELEAMLHRFGQDTKDKSERLVNASLQASKEAMNTILQTCAKTTVMTIKNELEISSTQTKDVSHQIKRAALFNITASFMTFLASCIFVIGLLLH